MWEESAIRVNLVVAEGAYRLALRWSLGGGWWMGNRRGLFPMGLIIDFEADGGDQEEKGEPGGISL